MNSDEFDSTCKALGIRVPGDRTQTCGDCGAEWTGPRANECESCRRAGGAPLRCFQCAGAMRWRSGGSYVARGVIVAECNECDAQYPLEAVRAARLGMLLERIAAESKSSNAAEEVGRTLLAVARPLLRKA